MIKLQNVSISVGIVLDNPTEIISKKLNIPASKIKSVEIFRRSVDVRKKDNPCFCYTFIVEFTDKNTEAFVLKKNKNASIFTPAPYIWKKAVITPKTKPIIVGSGPAGLFAALTLCRAGIPPIIIERGKPVSERTKNVENFWSGGLLNTSSNVQFGEGGAGTFSDGKLNTGIKDSRCRTVLEVFHQFGADKDILINAKPHIGTDILRKVVENLRAEIISLGGEYYFNTTFEKPVIKNGKVTEIICKRNGEILSFDCDFLILALGNAARDTFKNLLNSGISITSKPFAIGMRIEHLQENLNIAQYGENYSRNLPPLEYKLAEHLPCGRGVYTFCMCPGGVVVNSASEKGSIVTNGMSFHSRSGKNANSALLVGVSENDFGKNPLDGIAFQEKIEKAAFTLSGSYSAPAMTVGALLGSGHNTPGSVMPTILPPPNFCDITKIFPEFIINSIKEALPLFDKKIKGFANCDAILTAPETRSSSPVKIERNDKFEANIHGIFPCGEGAGYAGGITSSAVDGIRTAEALIKALKVD